jgi:hypothetical protein
LIRLTLDAEGGHRTRFEPIDTDRTTTTLAHAVRAITDAAHRVVDLVQQFALAVSDPQFGVAVGLEERSVGRVGKCCPSAHHLANGALGLGEQMDSLFKEKALEGLELALVHVHNLRLRPITAESGL